MEKSDRDDHDDHNDHDDHHSSFIIMSRMHFSKVFQMCPTSKIVTNPDFPNVFCFFSEMYKFIDADCSCSIGFQKVLVLVRFVLPCGHFCNLASSWSYGLPWGKSHVPKRPPWCRDGTGRVGREFPKAVLSFSY